MDRVQEIIAKEGIYETNAMLKSLDSEKKDWDKLSAAVGLAGVQKASNIAILAEHLNEFAFIPEVRTEKDIGCFFVENESEYHLDTEMREYFDYAAFGKYLVDRHDGHFVDGGFIYSDSDRSLDEILEGLESEDEGMDMGGM